MARDMVQVIAVSGGKGGVGKTSVAINLGVALSQRGRRVALLDADLGLANIDVLLGLSPRHTLEDVLNHQCSLADVLLEGPAGMRIVHASSGSQRMGSLNPLDNVGMLRDFRDISCEMV